MSISKPFPARNASDIEYVSFNDAFETGSPVDKRKAEKLLANIHGGLYNDTFPIPCEQESLDYWLNNLRNGREKGQQLLTAFGRNLDSDNPEIMGFICCRVLADSNCALIDYVIRDKDYAGELRGIEMCEHAEKGLNDLNMRINGQPLKAIFWEVNDPAKIEYDENNPDPMIDCMAPQKRIDIIERKFGCQKLGFDYIQGPLEPCSTPEEVADGVCEELLLYQYKAKDYKDVTAADLKKFIINYNKATNQEDNPRSLEFPSMNRMMNQLALMEKEDIPIIACNQSEDQKSKISECDEVNPPYLTGKTNMQFHSSTGMSIN